MLNKDENRPALSVEGEHIGSDTTIRGKPDVLRDHEQILPDLAEAFLGAVDNQCAEFVSGWKGFQRQFR
jgi:hypothetical protein